MAVELRPGSEGPALRVGIHTPIVVQTPGGHAGWEASGGPDDLRRLAVTADRLGYHHLTCSEHVGIPAGDAGHRGKVYWDPLATLSWVAAITDRILLTTNVVVLGYHHPAELLKSYGTLDRLSGGRVVLGVGVGTLTEEFDLLGEPFADRGRRADEALRILRSGWGRPEVSHDGESYRFGPLAIEPHAPRTDLPVWVGGRTVRSLRRAVTLGTGWTPFGLDRSTLSATLSSVERPDGFDVVLVPFRPLDPVGDPSGSQAALAELHDLGATVVHATFVHHSVGHYLEQLSALAELLRGV